MFEVINDCVIESVDAFMFGVVDACVSEMVIASMIKVVNSCIPTCVIPSNGEGLIMRIGLKEPPLDLEGPLEVG